MFFSLRETYQSNYFILYLVFISVSLLLGDAEIIKKSCQKAFESLDSKTDEEEETFESISCPMAISSLDLVRKVLVSQNVYSDKTAEKID